MRYGPVRSLTLAGSAEAIGSAHGAAFADEIDAFTSDRLAIAASGSWSGSPRDDDQLLSLAESMLPAHERYSETLMQEMAAMAGAAGISPAAAVVVGGFTDFVDAVRGEFGAAPYEDTCTAMIVPAAASGDGRALYAQTWDMHDSATPHVVLLDLRRDSGPASLVFTTVGCIGQIGINEAGIAVGINNLTATSGGAGVTWPFVVRRALQQTSLEAAIDCVLEADLAGAHNYLIVDSGGSGVSIEAFPQAVHLTKVETESFVHTNHALFADTVPHEAPRPPGLHASSHARLARAQTMLSEQAATPEWLMEITRDEEAVCQRAAEPYHIESCGAAVMRPATGEFWAVWGRPDLNEYELFALAAA